MPWLRARKLPILVDAEVIEFLLMGNRSAPSLMAKIRQGLQDEHVKMLNLGHDWINSYLPFILQKINRVHFGLLQPKDLQLLENDGVKIPTSRKLVAVPFVAKDVPSRASEFAHPDVLIGLTILAYRYEGLRKNDLKLVMRHLKDCMDEEGGPFKDRSSCQKFENWVLCAGKAIRGSKKKEKNLRRKNHLQEVPRGIGRKKSELVLRSNQQDRVIGVNIFEQVFAEEDDLIWPLQLIDLNDGEQFRVLFPLLYKLPHTIWHYLHEIIFPEVLAYQGLKLSACGQELGGDMIFGRRIGFSGTPSDILPQELGGCQYERGSDGKVVHYLTSPTIAHHVCLPSGWNVYSLLDFIATVSIFNRYFYLVDLFALFLQSDPPFHALIDTGALITGMSNQKVAEYLLCTKGGLLGMKGVVFLDELDRQMVLLRKGFKVVKLADSGLEWGERFTFYDQVSQLLID